MDLVDMDDWLGQPITQREQFIQCAATVRSEGQQSERDAFNLGVCLQMSCRRNEVGCWPIGDEIIEGEFQDRLRQMEDLLRVIYVLEHGLLHSREPLNLVFVSG